MKKPLMIRFAFRGTWVRSLVSIEEHQHEPCFVIRYLSEEVQDLLPEGKLVLHLFNWATKEPQTEVALPLATATRQALARHFNPYISAP